MSKRRNGFILKVSTAEKSGPDKRTAPKDAPPRPASDIHITTTRLRPRSDDFCGCAWCCIPEGDE